MELVEAVKFNTLEGEARFNLSWKDKFSALLVGHKVRWTTYNGYSTGRTVSEVLKIFVGNKTGNIFIKTTDKIYVLDDFGEIGYKKPHLEGEDDEATEAILLLIAEYKAAYNTAAKEANGDLRSAEYQEEKFEDQIELGKTIAQSTSVDLKKWLAENVTNIKFTLPSLDKIPASEKRLIKKINMIHGMLEKQYPGITQSSHFGWENKNPDGAIFSFWSLTGFTYFKVPYAEFPAELQDIIVKAKDKSLKRGQANVKPSKPTDKVVNNIYVAHAILDMFDGDYTFCDGRNPVAANPFDLDFDDINAYGEKVESLREAKEEICCICGEPIEGYGNNPEPYKHEGRCCDACNLKFVIPARLALMQKNESLTESAHYVTDHKGYSIYKDEGGGYWCQRGYTDQCWDKDFDSLSEIKDYINKHYSDYAGEEW